MFLSIWTRREKLFLQLLLILWLSFVVSFWIWWFQPQHYSTLWGSSLTTLAVIWTMLLPGYSYYFILRMKQLSTGNLPKTYRVAMVVTKTPTEPFAVVSDTLLGMINQDYPHDTWVADEDPSPQALVWYERHGVYVSSRRGHPDYFQETWPRRKKCKEGNLAFFYDHYGYSKYDFVIQLDADHIPSTGYLEKMLLPFSDPRVGYVSAPSICDSNHPKSWSARARSQTDSVFHGPIQTGSNSKLAPICIGSHYAVRTAALKQIGGIGPELVEDYSTTLMFNAHKWKGVFVPTAYASGEGPNSFEDIIIQDYQWARSMFTIFLTLFPRVFSHLTWRLRIQFIFSQLWYPFSALIWLISLVLPLLALLTGISPVKVNFGEFILFSLPIWLLGLSIYSFAASRGHLRPHTTKLLSWENALFELARWPWVLIASFDALFSVIFKKTRQFKVTSKTKASSPLLPIKIISPYVFIVAVTLVVISLSPTAIVQLSGYYYFALVSGWAYLLLSMLVLLLHIRESAGDQRPKFIFAHLPHALWTVGGLIFLIFTTLSSVNIPATAISLLPIPTPTPIIAITSTVTNSVVYHTVTSGESLWHISRQYYGRGSDWTTISRPRESTLIYPGEVLELPLP